MKAMHKIVCLSLFVIFLSMLTLAVPKPGYSEYPEKPITFIYGWSAGGMGDTLSRILTDSVAKMLGQPVVFINKPGGHGIVAAHMIVKAKPDGYTIGSGVSSQFLVVPNMKKVDFDPVNDPTQIQVFFNYDLGILVSADSPWKTWEELKDYAKKNPGKIRYGTPGVGTMQHLTLEMLRRKEGINWIHIPFKGSKEPVAALLGGHLEMIIVGPADSVPHIKAGKMRLLLAMNPSRWPVAPDVPHLGELGYDNTFSYKAIYGPKGLPESIRSKLETAFHNAMKEKKFIDTTRKFQVTVVDLGGREYTEILREKFPKYQKLIKELKIGEIYK